MPRWARFLSCSLTGLLISLTGFVLAAYGQERATGFWGGMQEFLTTPEFWSLVWLCALIAGAALLLGRIVANLWGWAAGLSGFLAGGALALCYVAFLLASHLDEWGGWRAALPRIWPASAWLSLPFALAGAFATWLWEQLE